MKINDLLNTSYDTQILSQNKKNIAIDNLNHIGPILSAKSKNKKRAFTQSQINTFKGYIVKHLNHTETLSDLTKKIVQDDQGKFLPKSSSVALRDKLIRYGNKLKLKGCVEVFKALKAGAIDAVLQQHKRKEVVWKSENIQLLYQLMKKHHRDLVLERNLTGYVRKLKIFAEDQHILEDYSFNDICTFFRNHPQKKPYQDVYRLIKNNQFF